MNHPTPDSPSAQPHSSEEVLIFTASYDTNGNPLEQWYVNSLGSVAEMSEPQDPLLGEPLQQGYTSLSGSGGYAALNSIPSDPDTGLLLPGLATGRCPCCTQDLSQWLQEDPVGFEAGDVNQYRHPDTPGTR